LGISNRPEESVHQRAIGQHNDLNTLSKPDLSRWVHYLEMIYGPGRAPREAAISGARDDDCRLVVSENSPACIHKIGIERVGGQAVLIVRGSPRLRALRLGLLDNDRF